MDSQEVFALYMKQIITTLQTTSEELRAKQVDEATICKQSIVALRSLADFTEKLWDKKPTPEQIIETAGEAKAFHDQDVDLEG